MPEEKLVPVDELNLKFVQNISQLKSELFLRVEIFPWNFGCAFQASVVGDTFQHKEIFKQLGMVYKEIDKGGVFGVLDTRNREKGWVAWRDTPAEINRFVNEIMSLIPELTVSRKCSQEDLALWLDEFMRKKEKLLRMYEECEELEEKPALPEILKGGRWNGKIYGYGEAKKIYIDREEKVLTKSDIDAIQTYKKKIDAYNKKKLEIQTKYADVKDFEQLLLKDPFE